MCVCVGFSKREKQSEMQDSASICGTWGRRDKNAVQLQVNLDTWSPYLNSRAYSFQEEYDIVARWSFTPPVRGFKRKFKYIHTTREARRIGSTGTFPSGNFDGWYYVKHKWVGRSVRIRMMFLPQRSWWTRTKKERCAHAASVSLCLLARKYFPHIIGNNHKNAKEINLYCCNLCQFYWVCQSFLTFCAWI